MRLIGKCGCQWTTVYLCRVNNEYMLELKSCYVCVCAQREAAYENCQGTFVGVLSYMYIYIKCVRLRESTCVFLLG